MLRNETGNDDGSSFLAGIEPPSPSVHRSGQPSNLNQRRTPPPAAVSVTAAKELEELPPSIGFLAVQITARFKRPSIKVFRSGDLGEDRPPSETLKTARWRDEEP
jgi:hypothetical protein